MSMEITRLQTLLRDQQKAKEEMAGLVSTTKKTISF